MAFAAIDAHLGLELGRKDDVESLLYTLAYMSKGDLPWIVEAGDLRKYNERVIDIKMNVDPREAFSGVPSVLLTAYNYIRTLSFHDTPNY